jgi:predicted DNA-binding protein
MEQMTITLPAELKHHAEQVALATGVSLAELIRASLEEHLQTIRDPLFADEAVFSGESPSDLAKNHDHYLYDDLH